MTGVLFGSRNDASELTVVIRERGGAVVRKFSSEGDREIITDVRALAKDPATASRCREVADRELSLRVGAARDRRVCQEVEG